MDTKYNIYIYGLFLKKCSYMICVPFFNLESLLNENKTVYVDTYWDSRLWLNAFYFPVQLE